MPQSHDAAAPAAVSHAPASGQPGSMPHLHTAGSQSAAQRAYVAAPQSSATPTPTIIIAASKTSDRRQCREAPIKTSDGWQSHEAAEPSAVLPYRGTTVPPPLLHIVTDRHTTSRIPDAAINKWQSHTAAEPSRSPSSPHIIMDRHTPIRVTDAGRTGAASNR